MYIYIYTYTYKPGAFTIKQYVLLVVGFIIDPWHPQRIENKRHRALPFDISGMQKVHALAFPIFV